MAKEKSAGAIIVRIEREEPVYLLLHYPKSRGAKKEYWDLPKGHVEQGETEEQTVRREVREETGLGDIKLFKGFREEIHYWFQVGKKKISKTVVFYAGKTGEKDVTISAEHVGFIWLPYEKALERLTFENAKKVLRKASKYMNAHDNV